MSGALVEDAVAFASFNQRDFRFAHGLGEHPAFTPAGLAQLAERLPRHDGFFYWQNGNVGVHDGWTANPGKRLSLMETIEAIAESDSLVILKHAEQDKIFGPVLKSLLQETFSLAPQDVRNDIVIGESLVFLTSPFRKTAYHFDLEASCLLQISGDKTLHVFDRGNSAITPDEELERHCAGDHSAARYKESLQPQARSHKLSPGLGVHLPSTAPHWAENGAAVSVSVNINYDLRSVHHRKKSVYRVNRVLRQAGLSPTPPGVSRSLDDIKCGIDAGVTGMRSVVRDALKGRRPVDHYPVWRPPAG